MDVLISAVSDIGFPMVVAIYLLTRIEGKMENLTVSINNLSTILDQNLK
ncbi:YvrJ family protein [Youngiibacter multivorans]|uniref:YvrJ family protein n=1 Tax=Youngiibacter multivorans TaxID=937251 RepID=A0ABS4G943_9CLOT|nr:YvrJ family protein [Youngiibacter multivorans]MBP1920927.1 hypothetical protein [Youngiibacter multivorans]